MICRLFAAALLALAQSMTALAASADDALCAPAADIARRLAQQFGERPVARGLTEGGALLDIWANDERRTWTAVLVKPDGEACLIASGRDWAPVFTITITPKERQT